MDMSVVAEAELSGSTPTFQPQGHHVSVCVGGLLSSQSSPTRSIIYGSRNINSETCSRADELSEMLNGLAAYRTEF